MLDDPATIARWIDGRVRYWLAYLSRMHRCRKTPEQILMVAEKRARDEAWSREGDVVFSPFAGIGSEGYVAIQMNRRFIGIELKKSYFDIAKQNLIDAEKDQVDLFA